MNIKLLLGLFILFLIPIGLSSNINFDYNATLITNDLSDRIYAYNYPTNESWIISYQTLIGADNLYASSFNEGLDTLLLTTSITSNGVTMTDSDCSFYDGNSTYGNVFKCISVSGTTTRNENSWWFKLDTNTRQFINSAQGTSGNYLYFPSVANTRLELWKQTSSSSDLKYTLTNNYGTNFVGDGTLDLPISYENIEDMQLRDCGGMYHVVILKNSKVYDLIYDYSRNYKIVYLFSPIDWITTVNDYGLWCDNNTNSLYVTVVNNTFNEGKISFQKWNTGIYSLTNVWSEILNQTTIEPLVNGTSGYYINKPFLTKDRYNRFYLFYEYNIPSTNQLRVSAETYCYCGSWINTTECSDNYVKQIRNCPFDCDNEEQYIPSLYCSRVYNYSIGIISQNTMDITKNYVCQLSVSDASPLNVPEYSCSLPIEIPFNCTNAQVNATLYVDVDYKDLPLISNNMEVYSKLCLPDTDCDTNTSMTCDDFKYSNVTYKKYYSAIGGENITYTATLKAFPCGVNTKALSDLFKVGWKTYTAYAYADYSCSKICGGYRCINENGKDYSVIERADCSLDTSTKVYCPYSCIFATGKCLSYTGGEAGGGETGECSSDDFLCEYIHPNTTKKLIYGLSLSMVIGFVMMMISSNIGVKTPFIFLIGFAVGFIIFTFINWIPAVFSIVIIFMSGLYALTKFL